MYVIDNKLENDGAEMAGYLGLLAIVTLKSWMETSATATEPLRHWLAGRKKGFGIPGKTQTSMWQARFLFEHILGLELMNFIDLELPPATAYSGNARGYKSSMVNFTEFFFSCMCDLIYLFALFICHYLATFDFIQGAPKS